MSAAPAPDLHGPPVPAADFDALFERLAAGVPTVPGVDGSPPLPDPRGSLAALDDATRLRALGTARTGRTVSLAWPLDFTAGPDNAKPALHHMVDLGDVEPPEPSGHKDFIGIDYHGKATSHLDAVCHIGYRGSLFGGVASRSAMSSQGSSWAAVTHLADNLVLHGVLLDVPVVRGVDWLEPGTAVRAEELLAVADALGVSIGAGDAVLLRSGHGARKRALGPWDAGAASAGLHVDAMPLLAERRVALLGGDGDSDVRPSPVPGVHSPIHALALTALGMPLLDNLDLEALSLACSQAGRYEFALIVAPLVVPGGTGSPVNPLAVL